MTAHGFIKRGEPMNLSNQPDDTTTSSAPIEWTDDDLKGADIHPPAAGDEPAEGPSPS